MRILTTTAEVIDELGGNTRVAKRMGVKQSAVANQRSKNLFPPKYERAIQKWLGELPEPAIASDDLFNWIRPSSQDLPQVGR